MTMHKASRLRSDIDYMRQEKKEDEDSLDLKIAWIPHICGFVSSKNVAVNENRTH